MRLRPIPTTPAWLSVLVAAMLLGAATIPAGAAGASGNAAAGASLPSPVCSWAGETDQRDGNIGAPDSDAHYWLAPLAPDAGSEIEIAGSYPQARYFSFHLYNLEGEAVGSLYDQQIAPDRGSSNPFVSKPKRGSGEDYELAVRFEAAPADPAPNTLYAGQGQPGAQYLLVYRVYVPANSEDPEGGVPYPQITIAGNGGTPSVTEAACATTPPSFGSALWQTFAEGDYPEGLAAQPPTGSEAPATPSWARAFGSKLGNQQNAYLQTTVSRARGQLVVIHTQAPTFPDTSAGQPAYKPSDLRYWSFCTYAIEGEALVGCAADYHAAVTHHAITYVISDPEDRPADATFQDGVTWLPWGAAPTVEISYRNMLPSASFPYAANRITSPEQNVQQAMGPFYPTAVYCSRATFEAGGWKGCGA
jgi:hypothetical protein